MAFALRSASSKIATSFAFLRVNGFFVEAIYSRRNNRVNAILPIADIPEWEGYVDQVLTNLLNVN